MIIKGHVTGNVNIRIAPTSNTSTTEGVIGVISNGQNFTGSGYEKDSLNRNWIKLSTVAGVQSAGYIAAYISTVVVDQIITDTPPAEENLGIPEKVTTIEEFKLSDGSIRKRTIVWDNPQVIEE